MTYIIYTGDCGYPYATLGNKVLVPADSTLLRDVIDAENSGCYYRRNFRYELRNNPKPKRLVARYGVNGKLFSNGSYDEDCWFNFV